MMRSLVAGTLLAVVAGVFTACQTTPSTAGKRLDLQDNARSTMATMRREDPSMAPYFDDAHGYVVFPSVGRGAFIAGGSFGRGAGVAVFVLPRGGAMVEASVGGQRFRFAPI